MSAIYRILTESVDVLYKISHDPKYCERKEILLIINSLLFFLLLTCIFVSLGKYSLEVKSTDKSSKISVKSTVNVDVININKESIDCAIPIRFSGLRKPLTCKEVNYIEFGKILNEVLDTTVVGADNRRANVFSMRTIDSMSQTVDMWFYVSQGEGCIPKDELLVLVYNNWEELQKRVGE